MQLLRIFALTVLLFIAASPAQAQYGLYGSPDPIPTAQPAAPGAYGYQPSYATYPPGYTAPYPSSYPTSYPAGSYPAGYAAVPTAYTTPGTTYPAYSSASTSAAASKTSYSYNGRPLYRTAAEQQGLPTPAQTPTMVPTPPPMPMSNGAMPEPSTLPADPRAQSSNVMNQMLNEQNTQGAGGYPNQAPCGVPGPYKSCVNQYEQAAACSGNACDLGGGCGFCPWYVSVTGLVLSRNDANRVWTTYQTGNEPNQLMNTQDARTSWEWGGEIKFGRRFGCNPCDPSAYWALEASYWTTGVFAGDASMTSATGVSTPFRVSYLNITDQTLTPRDGTYWFDSAAEHRIRRRDEFQNVEISLVRGQWSVSNGSCWDFSWSLGPRFFRFEEDLLFGTSRDGVDWTGWNSAYIDSHITNELWGGQLGFDLGYNLGRSLRFFASPKFGVYNNHTTLDFTAYAGGTANTFTPVDDHGNPMGSYPVHATADNIAFMGQIDVGLEWFFAPRWSIRGGYRVVAVTGMGLADNQIPMYINDVPEIGNIESNGDLVLHGAFATLTFNF